jgi:hypothetical protein
MQRTAPIIETFDELIFVLIPRFQNNEIRDFSQLLRCILSTNLSFGLFAKLRHNLPTFIIKCLILSDLMIGNTREITIINLKFPQEFIDILENSLNEQSAIFGNAGDIACFIASLQMELKNTRYNKYRQDCIKFDVQKCRDFY